jgi:hypothetical protein
MDSLITDPSGASSRTGRPDVMPSVEAARRIRERDFYRSN